MDATRICLEKLTTPVAALLLHKRGQPAGGKHTELRSGDLCPDCGKGRLGFDGLLNLACSRCDFILVGGFT
jgi:hypothetical protein